MIPGTLSDPLCDCIVSMFSRALGVVAVVVGGIVDRINQKCDGGEVILGLDVDIA